jgi:hypothetical protein
MSCLESTLNATKQQKQHTIITDVSYVPLASWLLLFTFHFLWFLTVSRAAQSVQCLVYGLDDRAIKVQSSAGAKDFSSNLCVQTGSGAHPASCTMGTGVPSQGLKRGRGVTLTIHPHLVPRSRMSRSYTSSPPSAFMACSGTALALVVPKTFHSTPLGE